MTTMTPSPFNEADLGLIRASLRHVLATHEPPEVTNALLAEGWLDLVDTDEANAITMLSEEAGRARSAAPVLDLAVLRGAGIEADDVTTVVIDNIVLAGAERAQRFLFVTDEAISMADASAVRLAPTTGFDPALGLSKASTAGSVDVVGDADAAASARASGRRALASQMVGSVDQMLADTLGYITERHQYGRAIGSFQTVKHRMAEVEVARATAQAAVRTAWEAADSSHRDVLAIGAKCLAGRAQQLASTHCFQVHGGIAFTVEHGFHQWVRRGLLLDLLLGGSEQLTRELGRRLITAGQLPRLPELSS